MTCFVSFNINGIRARQHQLEAVREVIDPDVMGLQETKVHDDQFPLSDIEGLGYHVEYFGQKGHYGVALLSKAAPVFVQKGFPGEDEEAQKRFIHARYEFEGREVDVLNGYFPQGESQDHPTKFPMKRAYYANLMAYIDTLKSEGRSIIVMGDMNIAPEDIDIGIGEVNAKRWLKNRKTSFLPEEREWYSALMSRELTDTYRLHYPESTELYSWFDYRSRGFNDEPKRGLRIDHILCTSDLIDKCIDAGISYELRAMEKPSDHAPIWSAFDLKQP
ncbi:exodeoxyribonuclease III [Psychrobacter sp. JCM 18900]|uniref:exodeoxyribonuclease III n=1 Tax=Psychrobacter sp. JCM 18900 TaxID=1298608 RepID=UPI0004340EBB|nr:exodeoxyribonuclease III [Psychrobacter sp. JCM 18900]GAF52309.1 exodeoxyribonuclease III [Psychrobacter sp. JCM 18900]